MFVYLVTYTAFISYTGFLLTQFFRICAVASNAKQSDTFRLKFGQFNLSVSENVNRTTNRTSVGDQPKGSVSSVLNIELVSSLNCCSHSRYSDSKPGNSLIREITRAPPGKSHPHFVSYLYKGLSNRVISQLFFKTFFLLHLRFSRY